MLTAICCVACATSSVVSFEDALSSYRWPAEWEPHAATWLCWPHNLETWPDSLSEAEDAFVAMCLALAPNEAVRIGVAPRSAGEVRKRLHTEEASVGERVEIHRFPTNDAWVRDHGPIVLTRTPPRPSAAPSRILLDFRFDNWGRKYPAWELDDAVPLHVARALGIPRVPIDWVLEGGSIDGDGRGTVLTTESCLLNSNRAYCGPARNRASMEAALSATLGTQKVVWLAAGIAGDDTDGHVDDVARFVRPGVVAAVRSRDESDPDHAVLEENWRRLRAARDAGDRAFVLAELPVPPPLERHGRRLPASYANFYLANGVALVPVFGAPSDERALRTLAELLPDRAMVPIPSAGLLEGLGALHCATQQEPLPPRADSRERGSF